MVEREGESGREKDRPTHTHKQTGGDYNVVKKKNGESLISDREMQGDHRQTDKQTE